MPVIFLSNFGQCRTFIAAMWHPMSATAPREKRIEIVGGKYRAI
jgi:hypothetical protein